MSIYNGMSQTLHEQLTQLLMDNGASVSKPSIDALVRFIALRDQSITARVVKDAERTLQELQADTRVTDLPIEHPDTTGKVNYKAQLHER